MTFTVNLFVHGVPSGQKTWGATDDDLSHINLSYNPSEWTAPEFLKVESTRNGIYYTFIKAQNVCDVNGRRGAYFGLTLRMNNYYADIQNVYNILSVVYQKICLGTLLKVRQNTIQFVVSDFKEKSQLLKRIEAYIIDYIEKFSLQEDILSPTNIPFSKGGGKELNLQECAENIALLAIKSTGYFKVSPYYLSSQVAQIKAENAKRMEEQKEVYSQEIRQIQSELSATRSSLQTKLESQRNKIQEAARRRSDEEYRHAEKYNRLQQELDSVKNENEELKRQIRQQSNDKQCPKTEKKETIQSKNGFNLPQKFPVTIGKVNLTHNNVSDGFSFLKHKLNDMYCLLVKPYLLVILILVVGFSIITVKTDTLLKTQSNTNTLDIYPSRIYTRSYILERVENKKDTQIFKISIKEVDRPINVHWITKELDIIEKTDSSCIFVAKNSLKTRKDKNTESHKNQGKSNTIRKDHKESKNNKDK